MKSESERRGVGREGREARVSDLTLEGTAEASFQPTKNSRPEVGF